MKVLGFPAPPIAFAARDAKGPADIVFIRIEAQTDPFVILGAEVSVVKWALGDRSQ